MSYSPIADPQGYQMRQDKEHLNLLAIFHYIMGGLTVLGGFIPLIYVLFGTLIMKGDMGMHPSPNDPPPAVIGGIFVAFGIAGALICWVVGGLIALAGRFLALRKGQTLVYVVSALNCLHMPLGTALGVCTFIVLSRPSVKALFDPQYAMAFAEASTPANNPPWYRG